MREEITIEEWGKRIFDNQRYFVTGYDYKKGITFVFDRLSECTAVASYDKEKNMIIIENGQE